MYNLFPASYTYEGVTPKLIGCRLPASSTWDHLVVDEISTFESLHHENPDHILRLPMRQQAPRPPSRFRTATVALRSVTVRDRHLQSRDPIPQLLLLLSLHRLLLGVHRWPRSILPPPFFHDTINRNPTFMGKQIKIDIITVHPSGSGNELEGGIPV